MPQPQPLIKPNYPRVNWGNPITQGLVFDEPFAEGGGLIATDTANFGVDLLGTITSATWDRSFYGTDLDFSAAASVARYTGLDASANGLTAMSWEFLVYYRSTGGGGLGRIAQKSAVTPNARWQFLTGVSGGNQLALQVHYSTTDGAWNTGSVFPTNGWAHIVMSYDGSSLSNVPILYVNGITTAIGTSTQPVGTWQADDGELNIGNRHDGLRNWDGKIAYFRYWNRVITQTEVWSLFNNPWQIYRKPNFTPYYIAPAAAAVVANTSSLIPLFGAGM